MSKGPKARTEEVVLITKEYADAETQHIHSDFTVTASSQTMPTERGQLVSVDAQTSAGVDLLPSTVTVSTQTEDDTPDTLDSQPTAGPSSQTIPAEEPPSYARLLEEERDKIGLAEVSKWHAGLHSTAGIPHGVSIDALNEWDRLKVEVGFSCSVVDQVLANSDVRGPRQSLPSKNSKTENDYWLNAWTIITAFGTLAFLYGMTSQLNTASSLTEFPSISVLSIYLLSVFGNGALDQRLWKIYNDFSRSGVLEVSTYGGSPNVAWSLIRRSQRGARRLGWVPA